MEASWKEGLMLVRMQAEHLAQDFDFDQMEDAHFVFNGMNRITFPKTNLWKSNKIRWHRAGLGVFDYLLPNSHYAQPFKDEVIELTKRVNGVKMTMTCVIEEITLQTPSRLGDVTNRDEPHYSVVCGRAVLRLTEFVIQ